MAELTPDAAKAVIENGSIVIRVPLANLQAIMDGGFACCAYDQRYKVTDEAGFAKEIANELNSEDEEGSTPIHKLFDAAINEALSQGAQHAEPHETQTTWARSVHPAFLKGDSMPFEERARLIWDSIKDNLCDRGLFNGIDEETEAEIDRVQIEIIVNKLCNQ